MKGQLILQVIFALTAGTVLLPAPVLGQQVFTELREPAQVKTFQEVSEGLVCQCGCNMVLSTCAHVDCPFAIPVRRFLEDRVREGATSAELLQKMEYGFGPEIQKDERVRALAASGRNDLVKGIVHGFGAKISAHTSPLIPVLFMLGFLATALAVIVFWRRRRNVTGTVAAVNEPQGHQATPDQTTSDPLRRALDELEKRDK